MTGESVNLPQGGNDSAEPSDALNNLGDYDFEEAEDTANPPIEKTGTETKGETDEASEGQESEASETENESEEAEGQEPEAIKDDVTVQLPGGEKVALSELKAGYMKDADYRQKTTALSQRAKSADETAARVEAIADAFAQTLYQEIPPAPDPALSFTDPARFIREKAMHDQALSRVQAIMQVAENVKGVRQDMSLEDRRSLLMAENERLAERFPETKADGTRKVFMTKVKEAAVELGFTEQEIANATDHRMLALAHYAKKGLEAEKSARAAKQKVSNVPPVPPMKRGQSPNSADALRRVNSMKRFNSNPTIENAYDLIE